MNAFASWTQEMCDAHNAKVAGAINRTVAVEKAIQRAQKTPLMNKLEAAFHHELTVVRNHRTVFAQALTFKIGDDCRYTPDFIVIQPPRVGTPDNYCSVIAYEVKGPHAWEDSIIKLKTAAHQFQFVTFILVKRDKKTKQWTEKEIGK